MNDRIRKLASETDAWCDQNWAGHKFYDIRWEEKFAELIVRECADIARKWSDDYVVEDSAPRQIDVMIKQHLGVEE